MEILPARFSQCEKNLGALLPQLKRFTTSSRSVYTPHGYPQPRHFHQPVQPGCRVTL